MTTVTLSVSPGLTWPPIACAFQCKPGHAAGMEARLVFAPEHQGDGACRESGNKMDLNFKHHSGLVLADNATKANYLSSEGRVENARRLLPRE